MLNLIVFSSFIYLFLMFCFVLLGSSFAVFKRLINAAYFVPLMLALLLGFHGWLIFNGSLFDVCLFNMHFHLTSISCTTTVFLVILAYGFLVFLTEFARSAQIGALEPFFLVILVYFGACSVIFANDFFLFYLALEVVTICSFILACLQKFASLSTEASLKYFVLGAMSSGLLLFGVVLLYGFTGVSNFFDFKFLIESGLVVPTLEGVAFLISFFFIIVGLFFKLSVVPFHMGIPDVFDGVAPPVVFFLSTMSKLVVLVGLLNMLGMVFYDLYFFGNFLFMVFGVVSVILGSFAGLLQSKVFRLLAYSTVANAGFFLILLSLGTIDGLVALFNYFLVYSITLISFFYVLNMMVVSNTYQRSYLIFLEEYYLLMNTYKLETLFFSLIFFSFVGIPPLAGFFGKFFFFLSVFNKGIFFGILLMIFVLTFISTIYYLRVIQNSYFSQVSSFINLIEKQRGLYGVGSLSGFSVILFFFFQGVVLSSLNTGILLFFL